MASIRAVRVASNGFGQRITLRPAALRTGLASTSAALCNATMSQPSLLAFVRHKHIIPRPASQTRPSPATSSPKGIANDTNQETSSATPEEPSSRSPPPQYELTFTCVPCGARSKHKVSKRGYHHGSVLIACPSCKNRHVISDHLKIFGDRRVTVEDLLRERGQLVRKGTLGEDGDLEFWDDGTTTVRGKEAPVAEPVEQAAAAKDKWREEAPGSSFKNEPEAEGR